MTSSYTYNTYKPTTYTTNYTAYGNPTSYNTEAAKKSFNHSNSVNLDGVNNRNLSPLIKNDPLILSILAQNSNFAKESKAAGYTSNGNSAGINSSPYTSEKPKMSGLYTDQSINSPYSSELGGLKGRTQTNVPPIKTAGSYLPEPGTYTATSYMSLTDRPQIYSSGKANMPISNISNVNYLDPMAIDNSPIVSLFSYTLND